MHHRVYIFAYLQINVQGITLPLVSIYKEKYQNRGSQIFSYYNRLWDILKHVMKNDKSFFSLSVVMRLMSLSLVIKWNLMMKGYNIHFLESLPQSVKDEVAGTIILSYLKEMWMAFLSILHRKILFPICRIRICLHNVHYGHCCLQCLQTYSYTSKIKRCTLIVTVYVFIKHGMISLAEYKHPSN